MGKFSQPSLGYYLSTKREKNLSNLFSESLKSFVNKEGSKVKSSEQVGEMMTDAMDIKRRFLRSLTSGSGPSKTILKRGYVDLPLVAPAIGLISTEFLSPPTETLQTKSIRDWVEAYWHSHGFVTSWYCLYDKPDRVEMDWPRHETHIVQGSSTHIWVLKISW